MSGVEPTTTTTSNILQPGQRIKPSVSSKTAEEWIVQEFGHGVTRMKELNSYDDINYFVEVQSVDQNDQFTGKYVFKILNSMDSKKSGHIEAENECMLYLSSKGFHCPTPQKSKAGQLFSIVTAASESRNTDSENNVRTDSTSVHVVRLLSFVEGDILANIPLTKQLLFDAGGYLAKLDNALKDFSHSALVSHSSIWQLSHFPDLRQFTFIIEKDNDRFELVQSILKAFDDCVVPEYHNLEKGIIHGDFNEQNILVRQSADGNNHFVHGVIDFGDMHTSYYIFELAILLCYMMLECIKIDMDPYEGSGAALAGYMTQRKVSDLDLRLLRTCICARLCQSLVMGAYTHALDEGNTYLLTTSSRGWKLLNKLWNEMTDEQLQSIWMQKQQNANTNTSD